VTEEADEVETLTFEQLLARLEGVTAQLADGELGIEAAADLYERARVLHAAAGERLARVSRRIADIGDDGVPPRLTPG
jgi:exodeoxyribonuclease VII small subunit